MPIVLTCTSPWKISHASSQESGSRRRVRDGIGAMICPNVSPRRPSAGRPCATLTIRDDAGLGPLPFEPMGMPAEHEAGRDHAIAKGWLRVHESGIA